jgi:hypothetical protein
MQRITVIQVFRALGVEPSPDQSWSVGSRVATAYQRVMNEEPPKELRQKTSGSGSHCLAVYPSSWFDAIATEVLAVKAADDSQQDLFGGTP